MTRSNFQGRLRLAVAAVSFWVATPVCAAEPSEAALSRARRLFSEATALEDAARWQDAIPKLRAALTIKETPGLRYHLAYCEEQNGELAAASLEYRRAAALIRRGVRAPDVARLLDVAEQRLDALVPRLTVVALGGLQVVEVQIDGQSTPGAVGDPIRLDPGRHTVLVRTPNGPPFRAELVLAAGEAHTLEVGYYPAPQAQSLPPPPAPAPSQRALRALPPPAGHTRFGGRELVLVGEAALALGGLAVGIGYSLAASRASERARAAYHDVSQEAGSASGACAGASPPTDCANLHRALDDHTRASTLATVGFVGAGVGVAAIVVTWAFWPRRLEGTVVAVEIGATSVSASARF